MLASVLGACCSSCQCSCTLVVSCLIIIVVIVLTAFIHIHFCESCVVMVNGVLQCFINRWHACVHIKIYALACNG